MNVLLEMLWGLLPDRCEVLLCKRKGVRGNENIVNGVVMCDYCHAETLPRRNKNHRRKSDDGMG